LEFKTIQILQIKYRTNNKVIYDHEKKSFLGHINFEYFHSNGARVLRYYSTF